MAKNAAPFFFVTPDAKTLESRLDEKRGEALAAGVRVRLRENQKDSCDASVRDPSLSAIQLVGRAVPDGTRLNSGRVRACLRLGEAKGTENFSARQSMQIPFLLRIRAKASSGACTAEFVTLSDVAIAVSTRATSSSMST